MPARRILVVEDERIVALNLRRKLTMLGYQAAESVSRGDHALRSIEESRPDLVLMDIRIEGPLDGIATAARIPPEYNIPVIYLTSYSRDEVLRRTGGSHPYLLKPFSERELQATIQMTFARCQAEAASRVESQKSPVMNDVGAWPALWEDSLQLR